MKIQIHNTEAKLDKEVFLLELEGVNVLHLFKDMEEAQKAVKTLRRIEGDHYLITALKVKDRFSFSLYGEAVPLSVIMWEGPGVSGTLRLITEGKEDSLDKCWSAASAPYVL